VAGTVVVPAGIIVLMELCFMGYLADGRTLIPLQEDNYT
jgi:hypothetical protein